MFRGRTAVLVVALLALILLVGACSAEDPGATSAERDRRSAAAIKATAAQNRAAIARRRVVAAQRRAAAVRRKQHPTTPTTIVTQASTAPSNDLAAIQQTVAELNAAFRTAVMTGILNSTVANNWVGDGTYTDGQCISFETALGQGVVSETLVVHTNSLVRAPGWVDPVIGKVPAGRIYQMAIDEIQTLVPTGQQRGRTLWIHVTVLPNGHARLFLRCH